MQQPCESCGGRGRREKRDATDGQRAAGVDDGSRIRIAGNGEARCSRRTIGRPLRVLDDCAPIALFKRDGRDTFVDVPVSFTEAALGANDRSSVARRRRRADAPAGNAIRNDLAAARVRHARAYAERSAAIITSRVHVVVPTKLNKRQRDLLEEYALAGGDAIEDRTFFERVKDAFRPQ